MSSWGEAKRASAQGAILDAALEALALFGLDATMDQIAGTAGISRRTVFRHFPIRTQLIAQAVRRGAAEFDRSLPALDGDWRRWLHELCVAQHRANALTQDILSDLTSRRALDPPLADLADELVAHRRARNLDALHRLWGAVGGTGDPPADLVGAFLVCLSPHYTVAAARELDATPAETARLAETMIVDAIGKHDGGEPARSIAPGSPPGRSAVN